MIRLLKLEQVSLAKIKSLLGAAAGLTNTNLFADHHLAELEEAELKAVTKQESPTQHGIIECLILRDAWASDGENRVDIFDFTLPNDLTDYVISVKFDENDEVSEVSMES